MKKSHLTILLFLIMAGCSLRSTRMPSNGVAFADFDNRVKAYTALRDQMESGSAQLNTTTNAERVAAAEKELAQKISTARKTAKRGDIFTPEIEEKFRLVLNPEMKGTRGRNTRGIIFDEGPAGFSFKVNGAYPKDQPLGTVPPNILESLPRLPEDIEYRFIGKHLILRDARANLIIDFIPAAIA